LSRKKHAGAAVGNADGAVSQETQLCHCGRPLHYTSAMVRAFVERAIREHGELVTVNALGRRWSVPRHYIALHGLRAEELPGLGFSELPPE